MGRAEILGTAGMQEVSISTLRVAILAIIPKHLPCAWQGSGPGYLSSSSQCPEEVGLVMISVLQMSKPMVREVKELCPRSLDGDRWQSQEPNPDCLSPPRV